MKIAVYGSGGVGGYYGVRLAAAGEEVYFIARGAHFKAIKGNGLQVKSQNGDFHIHPTQVTDDPTSIGPVDVVMITVKLYDTVSAAEGCKSLINSHTSVVSFQNGVTAIDTLQTFIGSQSVWGGTTYILSEVTEPGLITHMGTSARLVFGELSGLLTPRLRAFHAACSKARIDAVVSTNILVDIWSKFSFLAALSGLTALTRKPIGVIRTDPDTRIMFQRAVEEVVALARAKGIHLRDDIIADNMKQVDSLPGKAGSSQLYDLTRGRRLELPWLSGAVSRLGRVAGVVTPVHDCIFAGLKFYAEGVT